jgi:serine/threonine protein kinase
MATNTDLRNLEQIGRYPVKRFINEGGMAWVFLVSDPNLFDAERALKLLKPDASVGNDLKRFQNEAMVLTKIQHPNLLRVYDFSRDEDTGLHFYTMDFIDGEVMSSLSVETSTTDATHVDIDKTMAVIDLEKTLVNSPVETPELLASASVEKVCGYFLDVLSALARLHREDIIHRDIKPQNIFLTYDGTAILGDLGIAKLDGDADMTEIGRVLGTPTYMAPELAMGGNITVCSDIFSLGLSMYRVLTGRTVYADSQEIKSIDTGGVISHLLSLHRDRREFEFGFPTGIPEAVRAVIRTACRMDASERYQDANAMTLALKAAITEPVSAKMPIRSIAAALATFLVVGIGYFAWNQLDRGKLAESAKAMQAGAQEMQESLDSTIGLLSQSLPSLPTEVIREARNDLADAKSDAENGNQDIGEGDYALAARMFGRAQAGYSEICHQLVSGAIETLALNRSGSARRAVLGVPAIAERLARPEWTALQGLVAELNSELPPSRCGQMKALAQRVSIAAIIQTKTLEINQILKKTVRRNFEESLASATTARSAAESLQTSEGNYAEITSQARADLALAVESNDNANTVAAIDAADRARAGFERASAIRPAFEASAELLRLLDNMEAKGLRLASLRITKQEADRERDAGQYELAIEHYLGIQSRADATLADAQVSLESRSRAETARRQALNFGLTKKALAAQHASFERADVHLEAREFSAADTLYRDLAGEFTAAISNEEARRNSEAQKTEAEKEHLAELRLAEETKWAEETERRLQAENRVRREAQRLSAQAAMEWTGRERALAARRVKETHTKLNKLVQ